MRHAPRPLTLSTLGEFGLIRKLEKQCQTLHTNVIKGVGDDAAILKTSPNKSLVASKDLAIEGIHFDLRFSKPKDIGYRTVVANMSDMAAMGAVPKFILVALAVPQSYSLDILQDLYRGFKKACLEYHISLVGGDTSASQSELFLSLTILGEVKTNMALRRQGAKTGDLICVTGTLGDSKAGLQIFQRQIQQTKTTMPRPYELFLRKRHLRPTARLVLGQYLSQHRLAHAAIDISDGLSGDLAHLCQSSQVGAELREKDLPISRQCHIYATANNLDPVDFALIGGEDYELLFTVHRRHQSKLAAISRRLKTPITCIGIIRPKSFGLRLMLKDGTNKNISSRSYNHFSLHRLKN
jgi:thiamine-monophosphate kinase